MSLDYTSRDYEGYRQDMIEQLKLLVPEYNDFSPNDMGIVLIELFASLGDKISYYNDKVANEVFMATSKEKKNVLQHLDRLTYVMDNSTPSRYKQVFEIIPMNNDLHIPVGTLLKVSGVSEDIYFETINELLIPKGCNGLEKDSNDEYIYSATVEQGFSVKNKILGSSDGSKYQEFVVPDYPVIVDTIMVLIFDGIDYNIWKRVENFIDSDANDRVYTVVTDELGRAIIQFGSGYSGKIPPVVKNGITAYYRVGGGTVGNVAPNKITELINPIAGVVRTFNPDNPIEKGSDEEDIEVAKNRGRIKFRTLERLVTPDDFREYCLLIKEKEVVKCYALPLARGCDIYVLGKDKYYSETDLSYILEECEKRKIIGYKVSVHNPTYVDGIVSINYWKKTGYEHFDAEPLIKTSLDNLFTLGKLDFGERVSEGKIIDQIMNIQAIANATVTVNYNSLKPNEILTLKSSTINYRGIYG